MSDGDLYKTGQNITKKNSKKKQTKKLVHSCCYVLHFKYIYTRTRYDIETIYFLIFS